MRVAMVTWLYAPYQGGVPTHVREVAKRLVASGVDLTILTTDISGALPVYQSVEGLKVCRTPAWPAKSDLYFAPELYRLICNGNWDLLHCQGHQTLVPPLAMLAALQAKTPFVVTMHPGGSSSWLRKAIKVFQWPVLRPFLARAERIIVTAPWEKEFFERRLKLAPDTFVIIPNGGDLPPPPAHDVPAGREAGLIISIGRLERYKGHHRVIEALPLIRAHERQARLLILGSGPYEAELWRIAHGLGMKDYVMIRSVPSHDREKLASLLRRASLITLLSEFEGHPMAITEALALGCSVLVSDHPGLQQFADRGLARSVPLSSKPEQIAQAVVAQLRNPHEPATIELTSWGECAAEVLQLYRSLLRDKRCAS